MVATGSKSSRFEKRAKRTCRGRVVATDSMVDRLVRDGGARLKKENLAEWRGERREVPLVSPLGGAWGLGGGNAAWLAAMSQKVVGFQMAGSPTPPTGSRRRAENGLIRGGEAAARRFYGPLIGLRWWLGTRRPPLSAAARTAIGVPGPMVVVLAVGGCPRGQLAAAASRAAQAPPKDAPDSGQLVRHWPLWHSHQAAREGSIGGASLLEELTFLGGSRPAKAGDACPARQHPSRQHALVL